MKYLAALTVLATLAGCQAPFPNENPKTYGAAVRATLASQVIAPQAHPDPGQDAAAATAAVVNYQRSYVSPTPQNDSAAFGKK